MATSNNALRVADLDFFSIKENIKNYLRSQSTLTDYDYEGSGLSVLLDVLAYNTYYNSFYLNMAANEAFLDTAQIRQNILSHAKVINYVPSSSQGALSKVNITVTPGTEEDANVNIVTLDKYTRFLGRDLNGVTYPFVTLNANTSFKNNGSFYFSNVYIKQGEVITRQFQAFSNNESRRYQIPSANVDLTTLSVIVQESKSNTYTEIYTKSTDITTLDKSSRVFFVEEDDNLNYTLYFGDDIIGSRPKDGNIIIVTYLDTVGGSSNNISIFRQTADIGGKFSSNVIIKSESPSFGGVNKEDISSIRFRAPNYYTAQNRAVTSGDYESLVLKDYDNIDSVSIWGGEEHVPVTYGKVFMSIKTKGYYALTTLEKEKIKNDLIKTRNVLTVIPEIIDPDYTFIQVRGIVKYKSSMTSKTSSELLEIVKNAVSRYNTEELNSFKSVFKKSKLQRYIEDADPSITTSDIHILLQKLVPIDISRVKDYSIDFFTPLEKGNFKYKFNTYPQIRVFENAVTSLVPRDLNFEEAPVIGTGIESIQLTNKGINYSTNPTIEITGDGTGAKAEAIIAGGRVETIVVTNPGKNYTQAQIYIIGGDGVGAVGVAKLENKKGKIRSFYYRENTGEKIEFNPNAGSIDYDTGRVTFTSSPLNISSVTENPFYDTNILAVNVISESDAIYPLRNRILTINMFNGQSVQLDIIAES